MRAFYKLFLRSSLASVFRHDSQFAITAYLPYRLQRLGDNATNTLKVIVHMMSLVFKALRSMYEAIITPRCHARIVSARNFISVILLFVCSAVGTSDSLS